MKVIVDNKIPYIKEAIERLVDEVVYLSGNSFTPEAVKDADALIIRTRTRCDQALLQGSRVKFIATATIGYDHIDTDYCRQNGITWTNAPGCNATSVAQYVQSSLILLSQKYQRPLKDLVIGIVGVGNVGSKVADAARSLGMRVLLNDPPRADQEGTDGFESLETLCRECDVITFHTPLSRGGEYRTFHLADTTFFSSLAKQPVIINTSRGEVIETEALLVALQRSLIRDAVIDVWENEPDLSLTLLERAFLGTPHIAGYSADGKANATRMSLVSLCRFFALPMDVVVSPPPPLSSIITADDEDEAYLKMYNPLSDSEALKCTPEQFEQLRGDYPLRRERLAYMVKIKQV